MLPHMGKGMVWRVISLGCRARRAVTGVLAASAHRVEEPTAPNVFVNVHVTLTDTKVILSPKTRAREDPMPVSSS